MVYNIPKLLCYIKQKDKSHTVFLICCLPYMLISGAGEMTRWLGALTLLQRTWVQLPASTRQLIAVNNSTLRGFKAASHLRSHQACICTRHTGKTHIPIKY